MAQPRVLVMVLAGGEGKRLLPLTNDRAKPAVPFGGTYRIIDFCLSNFANAKFLKIVVLTQYKSHSLDRHISQTWRFSTMLGDYVTPVPAQMRRGPFWFSGSADAIYQKLVDNARRNDANNQLYAIEAVMDYDPSKDLEKIRARLLAINFADDALNPPELDVLEPAIRRIPNARHVLIPAGPDTRGHFTYTLAAIWKRHLAEFMSTLEARQE